MDLMDLILCTDIDLTKEINESNESNKSNESDLNIEIECTIPIIRDNFKNDVKFIKLNKYDIIIIVKGDIENKEDVLFRLHSGCLTGDIFNSERCDCGQQLDYFFQLLNNSTNGLLLYVPNDEGRGIGIFNKLKAYNIIEKEHVNTFEANNYLNFKDDNRDFSYINSILNFFNIKSINIVTNNSDKIKNINEKFINKIINTPSIIESHNFNYLKTKQDKKEHNLKLENYDIICKLQDKSNNFNNKKIGILYTKWNDKYVKHLLDGYINKIKEFGTNELIFKQVSGSFDLIAGGIQLMKEKPNNYDILVFIGILLKGETSHYDFLMNSISFGIQQFQLKYEIPVINGILTCENEEQIKNRTLFNNHGVHWACATSMFF